MAENDVLKMKVADLKRELKLRGLPTNGNKIELQERLQTALLDGDLTLEDTSIAEDLLDDEALTDEEDKGLDLSNEDAVLQSPDKDEDKSIEAALSAQQQQKKVVLKRKAVPPLSPTAASTTAAISCLADAQANESAGKLIVPADNLSCLGADGAKAKVLKLNDLTSKDRLEMRAKKFGVGAATETVKTARAARFGVQEAVSSANGTPSTTASMDILKKRAERFGCSVSSRMVELERKEKLLKRQERFGASGGAATSSTVSSANPNGPTTNSAYAEKAKQRLERFKAAVK